MVVNDPPSRDEAKAAEAAREAREFRNALGAFPTGVTVVTTVDADGRPVGLTCNSFASVSLNPPLVLWSLLVYSPSMNAFQNASHFTVNVLSAAQRGLARRFATRADDKFSGVAWQAGLGGAPLLEGAVANFQCRCVDRYYGGDHVIFLGAVEAYAYTGAEPLAFARGEFGTFTASRPEDAC